MAIPIREFVGAMSGKRNGAFITTSKFTQCCASRKTAHRFRKTAHRSTKGGVRASDSNVCHGLNEANREVNEMNREGNLGQIIKAISLRSIKQTKWIN